jgi:cytochrome c oxidase assembly protein subunit 15
VLVAFQILLGGWTTSNYAAFGCPDFPTCHGDLWPQMDAAEGFNIFQTIGPNYLGGQLENDARVAIHFFHRLGAVVVATYLVVLAIRLFAFKERRISVVATVILAALVIQLALGITNVLMRIPIEIAVAHNAGAGILMLTLITLGARVWMAAPEEAQ